jgi:hypothetical protein
MVAKSGRTTSSILSCILSGLLLLLPLFVCPSQALAVINCPSDQIEVASDGTLKETPVSAEICISYGNNAVIRLITPLRPSNLTSTESAGQLDDPDLQVVWLCNEPQGSTYNTQVAPNTCLTSSSGSEPKAISYPSAAIVRFNYFYSKDGSAEELIYTTQISPSNIFKDALPVSQSIESQITDDGLGNTYKTVKTVMAVCSDGSLVKPPTPCRRRA